MKNEIKIKHLEFPLSFYFVRCLKFSCYLIADSRFLMVFRITCFSLSFRVWESISSDDFNNISKELRTPRGSEFLLMLVSLLLLEFCIFLKCFVDFKKVGRVTEDLMSFFKDFFNDSTNESECISSNFCLTANSRTTV